jgi:hypothetical protein
LDVDAAQAPALQGAEDVHYEHIGRAGIAASLEVEDGGLLLARFVGQPLPSPSEQLAGLLKSHALRHVRKYAESSA